MTEPKRKTKKWNILSPIGNPAFETEVSALASETNLTRVMARLLCSRGCHTEAQVRAFLHEDELKLNDPFLLSDILPAIERIRLAVERNEKIKIYGDYDVDGVTSVSLLYLYLREQGADVEYYIPSRIKEGYGLSAPAIDRIREDGVSLMITVDTGITANEEIAYAKSLGIETVVTDHHECRADLPEACAVVNPHRPDDRYPFRELAGVGVVFKLICAYETLLCRENGTDEMEGVRRLCMKYADLVAIGTIADVMPVVDENRLIIKMGLRLIEKTDRPGLMALIDAANGGGEDGRPAKRRKVNSSFIGFAIAPRMNAAGRVSDAKIAVELLLAENPARAKKLAEELCSLNTARQVEENRIAEQAYKKIEQTMDPEHDRVIVIEDDTWQQGIIGIVSSRITERYGLPSILVSFDGSTGDVPCGSDVGKGSGRSIKGMNLVEALTACEDLLVRFGGHELAAGLTVLRCNVDAFRKRINQYASELLSDDALCVSLDADCEVEMEDLTMPLAQEISMLEPFGIANPVPCFVLRNVTLRRVIPLGGGKHTKLLVEKDGRELTAIWFGVNSAQLSFEVGEEVDLLFQLNINEYQGVTTLQLIVQDMKYSARFERGFRTECARYEEIRAGAFFGESENVIPTRDDFAVVYTLLRKEYRSEHTVFPIRRLLSLLRAQGNGGINYIKLKFMIRVMQELQLCDVTETVPDTFVFRFDFKPDKTNIEKSFILRKLKSQQRV